MVDDDPGKYRKGGSWQYMDMSMLCTSREGRQFEGLDDFGRLGSVEGLMSPSSRDTPRECHFLDAQAWIARRDLPILDCAIRTRYMEVEIPRDHGEAKLTDVALVPR